jgi:hypothetical protein
MKPGDILNLDEDDYKYGLGDLTLRVERILGHIDVHDGRWLHVRGTAIWDGKPAEVRFVYVRLPRDHP